MSALGHMAWLATSFHESRLAPMQDTMQRRCINSHAMTCRSHVKMSDV